MTDPYKVQWPNGLEKATNLQKAAYVERRLTLISTTKKEHQKVLDELSSEQKSLEWWYKTHEEYFRWENDEHPRS